MKKLLVLLSLVALSYGQGMAFQQGTNMIAVGGNIAWGDGMGAVVAWDIGAINDMFSFGAEINSHFEIDKSTTTDNGIKTVERDSYGYFSPQFRFGFHPFGIPSLKGNVPVADVLDPYVVLHTGPGIWWKKWSREVNGVKTTWDDSDIDYGVNHFSIAAGIRWMFSPNVGLWSELDWDRFIIGVSFKL